MASDHNRFAPPSELTLSGPAHIEPSQYHYFVQEYNVGEIGLRFLMPSHLVQKSNRSRLNWLGLCYCETMALLPVEITQTIELRGVASLEYI